MKILLNTDKECYVLVDSVDSVDAVDAVDSTEFTLGAGERLFLISSNSAFFDS